MTRHYAYGLDFGDLDIAVVDDSKPMQTILRSTLLSFRVRRVRTYDTAASALEMMRLDPPNMIITDWRMKPMSGIGLLRTVRQRRHAPLCFLPVIFVTAHGTRTLVDRVLREGAQHVLAKPIAPSVLYDRILWTLHDSRPLVLNDEGRYVIEGMAENLDAKMQKWHQLGGGRTLIRMDPDSPEAARAMPLAPDPQKAAGAHPASGAAGADRDFAQVQASAKEKGVPPEHDGSGGGARGPGKGRPPENAGKPAERSASKSAAGSGARDVAQAKALAEARGGRPAGVPTEVLQRRKPASEPGFAHVARERVG
jgi:two-component system chemotaxis response regulator CheY